MIYGYIVILITLSLALGILVIYKDILHIGSASLIITFSLSSLFLLRSVNIGNLEGWVFGIIIIILSMIELMMAFVYFKEIKIMERKSLNQNNK